MSRRGAEMQGYYHCVMSIIPLGPSPSLHVFFNLSLPPRLCASYSLFTCPCDYD